METLYKLKKNVRPLYNFEVNKDNSINDYSNIVGDRLVENFEPTTNWIDYIRHYLRIERLYTKEEIDERWKL